MRSGSEASTWATPPVWSPQMLRCAQHDTSEGLFHSMTHPGHFFIACRKKATLTCHAERQRSIWFHQPGGMAHLGFFAALRMTCPGHFVMACHKKAPLTCHAERQRSIWFHQPGGMAHLGFFAALRMTCPGHFVMACHDKPSPTCHAERQRSIHV